MMIAESAGMLEREEKSLFAGRESVRLWESPHHFVVLGRSGRAEAEANLEACEADQVPVLRRTSGGGTVLQGPGCLNFSLVLDIGKRPELAHVERSYQVILGWVIESLGLGSGLTIKCSDLLLDGRKVSGNAQRRIPGWVLHHGTLLYAMDFELIARYLTEPPRQPSHRKKRTHREFLANLPLTGDELRRRLTGNPWGI